MPRIWNQPHPAAVQPHSASGIPPPAPPRSFRPPPCRPGVGRRPRHPLLRQTAASILRKDRLVREPGCPFFAKRRVGIGQSSCETESAPLSLFLQARQQTLTISIWPVRRRRARRRSSSNVSRLIPTSPASQNQR